ncbi:MAG: hypothetical protein ACREJ3_10020 [Polyangiaceae bacterium]
MMRGRSLVAGLGMMMALAACSFLKKPAGSDAGIDAGVMDAALASADAGARPLASNQSQVTRYPDEKAIEHATVTTEFPVGLRTQAGAAGDLIVNLKKGTEVDKLAEHGDSDLILCDDPKDSSHKLMGWLSETAFSAAQRRSELGAGHETSPASVDAGAQPSSPHGRVTHLSLPRGKDGSCPAGYKACGAACRHTCKTSADCGMATAQCQHAFCMTPGLSICK